jgi:hypothetical protein
MRISSRFLVAGRLAIAQSARPTQLAQAPAARLAQAIAARGARAAHFAVRTADAKRPSLDDP